MPNLTRAARTGCLSLMWPALMAAFPGSAHGDVTDRLARTVAVAAGTPITVEVTVGHVQVTRWERSEVAVEIVRRAPDAAALERLPASIDETKDGLVIRATQPDEGRDPALRADVFLQVPARAELQVVAVFEGNVTLRGLDGAASVRVERGEISAEGMSGRIRLETALGDIRLALARLEPQGAVRLRTFNGDVTLALPGTPEHARVLVLAMGGTITSDLALTRKERWGPRWGEATFGRGEPVLAIDVVNGDIVIAVR